MFINCNLASRDGIFERIITIPGVVYAFKLDNIYDIVVKIESDSEEKFTTAIAKIRTSGDIFNTDTMVGFLKKPESDQK